MIDMTMADKSNIRIYSSTDNFDDKDWPKIIVLLSAYKNKYIYLSQNFVLGALW